VAHRIRGASDRLTLDTRGFNILDGGPKAEGALTANMLTMHRPVLNANISSPRRFLLLPQESVDDPGQGPRIRRYQLTSVGRRPGMNGVDIATVRIARERGRLSNV
jgi:hypothetical protein